MVRFCRTWCERWPYAPAVLLQPHRLAPIYRTQGRFIAALTSCLALVLSRRKFCAAHTVYSLVFPAARPAAARIGIRADCRQQAALLCNPQATASPHPSATSQLGQRSSSQALMQPARGRLQHAI